MNGLWGGEKFWRKKIWWKKIIIERIRHDKLPKKIAAIRRAGAKDLHTNEQADFFPTRGIVSVALPPIKQTGIQLPHSPPEHGNKINIPAILSVNVGVLRFERIRLFIRRWFILAPRKWSDHRIRRFLGYFVRYFVRYFLECFVGCFILWEVTEVENWDRCCCFDGLTRFYHVLPSKVFGCTDFCHSFWYCYLFCH